tara:strand:+ start:313 stop:609 length:297 start_codon:yes stop_codon:yes gene_type:complete
MNSKIIYYFLMMFLFSNLALSNEVDCSQFKKMSAKYIECNAKNFKAKTDKKANELKVKTNKKATELKAKTDEKLETSGVKDKLKKFKNSKTLTDLIKD